MLLLLARSMQQIVVVGAGESHRKNNRPSLAFLERQGIARLAGTIDIEERGGPNHRVRSSPEQPLEELVPEGAVVLQSQPNEYRVEDTKRLIEAGFTTLIEKPYCLDTKDVNFFEQAVENLDGALLEYGLAYKAIPLLWLAGKTAKGVHEAQGLLATPRSDLYGSLHELLGPIQRVSIRYLEGKGDTGKVDHRGQHLTDTRLGGGMILDLGTHALAPMVALEDCIGALGEARDLRVARNVDYLDWARASGIPAKHVGESLAQFHYETDRGIPVDVVLGKYTPQEANHRKTVIEGECGRMTLDSDTYGLHYVGSEGEFTLALETANPRYANVLREGLEELAGSPRMSPGFSETSLQAHRHILTLRDEALSLLTKSPAYAKGTPWAEALRIE